VTAATRRAALLACLVLVTGASPALASTFGGSLAITSVGQPAAAYDRVPVTAQGHVEQACDSSVCGYFPFVTTVPAAQACDRWGTGPGWTGELYDTHEGVTPQDLAPSWQEQTRDAPVERRACLYANTGTADHLVAEATFTVPGRASGTTPTPPSGGTDIALTPIPRGIGIRRPWPFRISTAGIPPDVDRARFVALAKAAGARWGLPYAGVTRRVPRLHDGRNTVGFAFGVPRGALGITSVQSIVYVRRGQVVCRGGTCRRGKPHVVRRRIVEQDTRLAFDPSWEDGPGVPDASHFDLQTVILHELGHYAGNGHAGNCTNTPMWVALSHGEWWHTPSDWFQHRCAASPATASAATAAQPDARPERRRLILHVDERRRYVR